MGLRKRCRFMIDNNIAIRLETNRSRTGLSMAEQIRRAIDYWLESENGTVEPASRLQSQEGDRYKRRTRKIAPS
jgi:hypothetical protein